MQLRKRKRNKNEKGGSTHGSQYRCKGGEGDLPKESTLEDAIKTEESNNYWREEDEKEWIPKRRRRTTLLRPTEVL